MATRKSINTPAPKSSRVPLECRNPNAFVIAKVVKLAQLSRPKNSDSDATLRKRIEKLERVSTIAIRASLLGFEDWTHSDCEFLLWFLRDLTDAAVTDALERQSRKQTLPAAKGQDQIDAEQQRTLVRELVLLAKHSRELEAFDGEERRRRSDEFEKRNIACAKLFHAFEPGFADWDKVDVECFQHFFVEAINEAVKDARA